jgi:hypothetical protein
MAFQLEFGEERLLRELWGRHSPKHKGPDIELRRAYDALMELAVGSNTAVQQPTEEYTALYRQAFQAFNRGELQYAEMLARSVKHLCRAAWFDAKIKHLEGASEEVPHLPGLTETGAEGVEQGMREIGSRLARMKLSGMSDRFGNRARKHLQRITALPDRNNLLADTFMKAAYEYCLATECLRELELKAAA